MGICGPGTIGTGLDEIDGWKIAKDKRSCEQQGHVLKIIEYTQPARLGGVKLPKGDTTNYKPMYGSLYKPPYKEYALMLDNRLVLKGTAYACENAVFEYFRRERVVPGMKYAEEEKRRGPRMPTGRMGGMALMLMAMTIDQLAKQDPREFQKDDEIPDEFREQYARPLPEAPKDEEVPF
jgi:hypothetical protein